MKYIYNKLVRDNIPNNINSKKGKSCNYKILNDEEYLKELDKKLIEEAHEFLDGHSVEELGDLAEVILSIMKHKNISIEQVNEARRIKKDKNGGFENKIYLIDVEE
ncbi:MAG: nucleoside triphosphate pyrophosphohydrolase [Clostridia bacterium]|nr:nucleoside triphosphate pyrophosphohydrolase [Clostridia bacterium]